MTDEGRSSLRLDHVGISVGDAEALAGWYRDAMGFEEETRMTFPVDARGDMTVIVLRHPDGSRLELLERPGSEPGQEPDPFGSLLRRGVHHICFAVDDIDVAFAHLVGKGAGVKFPVSASPIPGARMAYLTDPEGNFVELLERAQD